MKNTHQYCNDARDLCKAIRRDTHALMEQNKHTINAIVLQNLVDRLDDLHRTIDDTQNSIVTVRA